MNNLVTINQLLSIDFDQLSETVIDRFSITEPMLKLKKLIHTEHQGVDWEKLIKKIVKQIENTLNKPIQSILEAAWVNHQDVKNFDTAEMNILVLTDHEITSKHLPVIEIELDNVSVNQVPFFLGIHFNLSAIQLQMKDNHIQDIHSGLMQGHVILQYQNITFVDQVFDEVPLKGLFHNQLEPTDPLLKVINLSDFPLRVIALPRLWSSSVFWFVIGVIISFLTLFIFWLLQ